MTESSLNELENDTFDFTPSEIIQEEIKLSKKE